jgi:hypothetical protein
MLGIVSKDQAVRKDGANDGVKSGLVNNPAETLEIGRLPVTYIPMAKGFLYLA